MPTHVLYQYDNTDYEDNASLPLILPIADVFEIKGRGCLAVGTVAQGMVNKHDLVDILGFSDSRLQLRVSAVGNPGHDRGIWVNDENVTPVERVPFRGHNLSLMFEGVGRESIKTGMLIASPGYLRPVTDFEVKIQAISADLMGRSTAIKSGYKPTLYFMGQRYSCEISLKDQLHPGMLSGRIRTENSIPIANNLQFALIERHNLVAIGRMVI